MPEKKSTNFDGGTQIGTFVGGDQFNEYKNVTQIIQLPGFVPPPNLEALRGEYLAYLQRTYRVLDFKGIPQFDAVAHELLLDEVYVPLLARPEMPGGETWNRRLAGRTVKNCELPENHQEASDEALAMLQKGESRPVRIEEAMTEKDRVIVLGDPGSGKTTLLKYLALHLAAEEDAPLPILIPLNAYARALQKEDLRLQAYLPAYFAAQAQVVADMGPLFDAAIEHGQALILLDGLDEVQDRRGYLNSKVEAFAAEAVEKGNKLIATSRIVGYKDAPLPSDWVLYTLLDFDRPAIEDFARKWCLAFEKSVQGDAPEAAEAAEKERAALLEAVDANPGVARLASNPLLLTILALIKRQGVSLPNRRVELYELYLETLIRSWNKSRALDHHPVGPELNYNEVLDTLGPLALWLREENPTAGVVSGDALLAQLTRHYMGEDWGLKRGPAAQKANEFLESVRRYSNLLLERGRNQYGFLHLTFEEMLAAYGIFQRGQLRYTDSLPIIQDHLLDPGWRETILLAVGVWGLANKQPKVAGEVVRAMLKMTCGQAGDCQHVLIAGACLEDVGEEGIGRAAANDVIAALETVMLNRTLPPVAQRDAGFVLGRLAGGSEAFLDRIRPDLDEFVPIPAGDFLYGDEKQKANIEIPFAIGKYPVTNLQFQRFMEDQGYERKELWGDEGWDWRIGKWQTKEADENLKKWLERRPVEKRDQPYYWQDAKWNNPLAPVVGVTWFEAEAYCNWLAGQLEKPVRLPTEQEWERAARGTRGREFSWGNDFEKNHLNAAPFWKQDDDAIYAFDMDEASTTPVGQFPAGCTPEGIADLSGNVWEWTDSWWEAEQINRVMRGGSWNNRRRFARCAFRLRSGPADFLYGTGFRVVLPGSDSGC